MGVLWRTARNDPVAAQQILRNSSLSAAVQAAVLTKMSNHSNRWNGRKERGVDDSFQGPIFLRSGGSINYRCLGKQEEGLRQCTDRGMR